MVATPSLPTTTTCPPTARSSVASAVHWKIQVGLGSVIMTLAMEGVLVDLGNYLLRRLDLLSSIKIEPKVCVLLHEI